MAAMCLPVSPGTLMMMLEAFSAVVNLSPREERGCVWLAATDEATVHGGSVCCCCDSAADG